MSIRLLSYNVRYADIDGGEHAWAERRDGVASVVRFHRPDVVCLQEVWRGQLADLRDRLPAYEWTGREVLDGHHTPVGYRSDRFAGTDTRVFALSETPEALTVPGWDANVPRLTTRTTLVDEGADARFVVFDTHFDHEGDRARLESARLLAGRVRDLDEPAVVAGDLNCGPGQPPYRALTDGGPLVDARTASAEPPHGPSGTYNEFENPRTPPYESERTRAGEAPNRHASGTPDHGAGEALDHATGEALDHVLVTPAFEVRRHGVLTDRDGRGLYPSDHFPVVVDLRLG